jgi:hypothetical protein
MPAFLPERTFDTPDIIPIKIVYYAKIASSAKRQTSSRKTATLPLRKPVPTPEKGHGVLFMAVWY